MGRSNQILAYIQAHYDGAVIRVTDEPIDSRPLNSFCVWVPDVGKIWLLIRWEPETHRAVVTINLPDPGVQSNAA